MHKLSIYKASAGSGKTFKLTEEYLKLIFNNENKFNEILAVTFTNKATSEMRERILKQLYILASNKKSDHSDILKKTFKLSDNELQKKAIQLLNTILHNYSRFNISTIDSFFQKILRAFTYETGLTSGFNVELNFKQILQLSIENFFSKDNKVEQWLSNFAFQNIEDGKNWDIEKDIYEFSLGAFNEVFFNLSESQLTKLNDIDIFVSYKKEIKKEITYFVDKINNLGQKSIDILEKYNLSILDFSYGKAGVAGYMCKLKDATHYNISLPGVRVLNALNSPDSIKGWCKNSSPKQTDIQACVNGGLLDIIKELYVLFDKYYETYNTALVIWESIDLYAVLVNIFNELNEYCKENNIFLLALASPLLSKMIGDSDAPFIYEKIGEYLKFFMIDEFQDTSKLQWNNFYPLFINSLSQGNNNMVVGDVKQSIYRWRNGDWSLLNNVLADDFKDFGVKNIPLEFNWRSTPEVIDFNNNIFKNIMAHAVVYLQNNIDSIEKIDEFTHILHSIYSSSYQKVPKVNKDHSGLVNIEFIGKDENKSVEEYSQWCLNKMIDTLNELFAKNIQPKDIAILVRTGKEGALVAKHLMEYIQQNPDKQKLFSFISNDSVLLGSSSIILLLISILEYLVDSKNKKSKASIIYFYSLLNNTPIESAKKILDINFTDEQDFLNSLPADFSKNIDSLKSSSLIVLVNRLLSIFIYSNNIKKISNQLPFINTFQDSILNYTKSNSNDIQGFLNWWNDYGIVLPVNLSDEQNAIRIITIHKSKGLEYNAVIIPFATWGLDQRTQNMWYKTPQEFNKLPIVPVKYSLKLKDTKFKDEYFKEKMMSLIDNINLLYVATTRAVKALYIYAPQPKDVGKYKLISDFIYNVLCTSQEFEKNWDNNNLLFRIGELKQEQTIENTFVDNKYNDLRVVKDKNKLKLRLSAKEYFIDDENNLTQKINKGNIYHKILEYIINYSDIDNAVKKVVNEGLLSRNDSSEIKIKLKEALSVDYAKEWFNGNYKVINELPIIVDSKTTKRPDRVMIGNNEVIVVDYKFTSKKTLQHINQVKEYVSYISTIEDKETKGYVWYVFDNILKQV